MTRIAVADVGTNSTLYLAASAGPGEPPVVFRREARTTRLGETLAREGRIGAGGLAATITAVREFRDLALGDGMDRLVAVGTQAFRGAENGAEAVRAILDATGVPLRVLTEAEEAEAGFRGAMWGRSFPGPVRAADIGGGSTEITLGRDGRLVESVSLPVGALVLAQRHFRSDPPSAEEASAALDEAARAVSGRAPGGESAPLVCTGGTATTLAALELGLDRYDPERVDGATLSRTAVLDWFGRLVRLPLAERRALMAVDPERAAILPAGAAILLAVLEACGAEEVRVSDRGLRFGILLREFEESEG